jgi:hypothetical protein
MNEIFNTLKKYALSDREMEILTGARVMMYSELLNYETAEELLDHNNRKVVLFYSSSNDPSFGHWCGLFFSKHQNKQCIEYIDSYGGKPDKALQAGSQDFKHGRDVLMKLLARSPYVIVYNHYKLQEPSIDINTCGMHVSARMMYCNLTLGQYKKLLDSLIKKKLVRDYDEAVILLNYNRLQSL